MKKPFPKERLFCYIFISNPNVFRSFGQIRDYGSKHLPVYIPLSEAKKQSKKGDILLARYGASLGKVFWAEDGAYNVALAKSNPLFKGELIERKFIYYYYLSPLYQTFILKMSRSAQAGFNKEDLNELLFPLPPLSEQKRIVEKIEVLMTIIKRYEDLEIQHYSLEQAFPGDLKKSILQAAMQGRLVGQQECEGCALDLIEEISKQKERLIKEKRLKRPVTLSLITEEEILFDLPANWQWVRLNDVADIFNGNSINAQVKKTHYEGLEVGYPYIATKDVGDDGIVYDNGVKIPYETSFKIACKGTTLVCAEGGSAGRKVGILNQDVCFGNKLFAIQQFKPILSNKFIYYFCQSSVFKTQFKSMMTGMIGGVSVTNFKKILIPIPPLEEQKRIVEKLDKLMVNIDQLESILNNEED